MTLAVELLRTLKGRRQRDRGGQRRPNGSNESSTMASLSPRKAVAETGSNEWTGDEQASECSQLSLIGTHTGLASERVDERAGLTEARARAQAKDSRMRSWQVCALQQG